MAWMTLFLIDPITKSRHKSLQINVVTSLDKTSNLDGTLKGTIFLFILKTITFLSCFHYEKYLQPYQRQICLISICLRLSCKVSKALAPF